MFKLDEAMTAELLGQLEDEGHARIFTDVEQAIAAAGALPDAWRALARSGDDPRATLRELWADAGKHLPRTLAVLERTLRGFAITVTDRSGPSLLYLFHDGDDVFAHRGFAPARALPPVAADLAVDLGPFYRLHDGWVNLFSADGGPLRSGAWNRVGVAPGVAGFLEVVTNGSRALGFDLDERPAGAYALDTDEEEVAAVGDFWAELDDWVAASLEE